jgi:hypothetical protein
VTTSNDGILERLLRNHVSSGIAGENRAPALFTLSDKRCLGRIYRLAEIGVSLPSKIFKRHEIESVLQNGVKHTRKVQGTFAHNSFERNIKI